MGVRLRMQAPSATEGRQHACDLARQALAAIAKAAQERVVREMTVENTITGARGERKQTRKRLTPYQAKIARFKLYVETVERHILMAKAAAHASDLKRLARLTNRLASEIDAGNAIEWPQDQRTRDLDCRANHFSEELAYLDHDLAQARRNRRRNKIRGATEPSHGIRMS
jgi:hypothetical protein